jgi:DHA1 family bicyclomycin/chloramphenicol resistance-like MFS transporter
MAIIIPNLAMFGRVFEADLAQVQFLVSAYALGLALAQPIQGVLSDRFGRRPIMLAGLLVFVVASLGCAVATTLDGLIIWRFAQALGISVGTVISRALIRDVCDTEQTARALSIIAASLGIAPVIAPIAGGYLGASLGWQAIFVLSSVAGVITMVWVYMRLPETRDPRTALSKHATDGGTFDKVMTLLRSGCFIGYTLAYGFVTSAFFVFLVVGANVFERELGIEQQEFGLIWGPLALTYVAGAMLTNSVSKRYGFRGALRICIVGLAFVAVALPLTLLILGVTAVSLLVPLASLMILSGLVSPLTLAGAVSYRPQWSGLSSGLSSSLGLGMGVFFALVSGLVYRDSMVEPVALMVLAILGTAMSLILALKTDTVSHTGRINVNP